MTHMSRSSRRVAASVAVLTALAALACGQDNISGPVDQIGPPLLDMDLQPGSQIYPAASLSLRPTHDTLTITLTNLPPAPTGTVYQVLLVDSAATSNNAVAATGQLIAATSSTRPVNRDSAVTTVAEDTTASTNQITAGGRNTTLTFQITDASLGGSIAAYTHAVVIATTTPVNGVTTVDPAAAKGFLARRFRSGATFSSSGSFTFGTWSITSANRVPFSQQGTGNSAFWGDAYRANFERILRPPEGWMYVGWLTDERTGIQKRLGGLQTPVPENRDLTNADVEDGSFLTDVAIVQAQLRAEAADADNYTRFSLVLEPKGAGLARAPQSEVFGAAIPASVASRHPGAGKLFGKVTGTNSGNATVYVTGRGLTTPLLVNVTDPNGDFRFRTVQVGDYTVNAIPAGDSVVRASQDFSITSTGPGMPGDSVYVTLTVP